MSEPTPFQQALQLHPVNDRYQWNPTSPWYQGRGVYGGLLFAVVCKAIQQRSSFPIRRLSSELCAPVLEQETTLIIQEKRRGVNTQFFHIELLQENKTVLLASATCGQPRASDLDCHALQREDIQAPTTNAIPFHPSMPSFSRFFEYWPILGGLPFSGAKELFTGGWIRCRGELQLTPSLICALTDSWWPSLYLAVKTPRPMGTISFSIDFSHPPRPTLRGVAEGPAGPEACDGVGGRGAGGVVGRGIKGTR